MKAATRALVIWLLLSICTTLSAQTESGDSTDSSEEIRSLWVLPWSINEPSSIDNMISQALSSGQYEILVEVRYRSDALYTPNLVQDDYPNPEYRSYILTREDFDPLAYALEKGHAHNLSVHAWVVVFNATPTASHLLDQNYIYNNHRGWLTYELSGGMMRSTEAFGYFIDPGIPDATEYVQNVICDLASGYPELDGIHLDYIRYPNTNYGHHPTSVARYNLQRSVQPELSWNRWRIQQVTSFLASLRAELRTINPDLLVSAAVFPDISEARNQYAQDWYDWLERGLLDRVYPMLYHTDDNAFLRVLDQMSESGYKDRIVMGLRAWDQGGGSLMPARGNSSMRYDVHDLLERIDWVRQRSFPGIALFSYDGLVKGNALSYLGPIAYPDRRDLSLPPGILSRMHQQIRYSSNLAPEIYLASGLDRLSVQLVIPEEGRWKLQIYDQREELLWEKDRYYLEGTNLDVIDALPLEDALLSPGEDGSLYYFHLYQESGDYKYIIPLRLGDEWPR